MTTTPVAWLFPGQGSQTVGMGKDLAERYPGAARVFEEANDAIGVDLRALCFDGPQDELDKTANTQPALVAASIAAFRAAEEAADAPLPEPVVVLGHSLGEFSALVAAGHEVVSAGSCARVRRVPTMCPVRPRAVSRSVLMLGSRTAQAPRAVEHRV